MNIQTILILCLTAITYVSSRRYHHPEVYEDSQENIHRTEVLRRTRQSKIQQTYNPVQFDIRHAQQQDQQKNRYLQQQSADQRNRSRNKKLPRPQSYNRQERVVPHLKETLKTNHKNDKPIDTTTFSKRMLPVREERELDSSFEPSEQVSVQIQTSDGWKVIQNPVNPVRTQRSSKYTQLAFFNNNVNVNEQHSVARSSEGGLLPTVPPPHELLEITTHRPVKKLTIKEENITQGETVLTNIFHTNFASVPKEDLSKNGVSYQVSENTDMQYATPMEQEVKKENIDRQDVQHQVVRLRVRKARKQTRLPPSDQKLAASQHGYSFVTPNQYVFLPTTVKPESFHQNIHALSALLGKHPQQQLQGLQTLLGEVQHQEQNHFQTAPLQYFSLKDHTPITEHVPDVANPQDRPNVKIVSHPNPNPTQQTITHTVDPLNVPQYFIFKQPHLVDAASLDIQKALFAPDVQKETEAIIQTQANDFALQQKHVHQQLENVARAQEIANSKIHAFNEEQFFKAKTESEHKYSVQQRVKAVDGQKQHLEEADEGNEQYASKYAFGYRVRDGHSGNDYGHQEKREGKTAKGHYHVLLPDGRVQDVQYEAGPGGYSAKVTYH